MSKKVVFANAAEIRYQMIPALEMKVEITYASANGAAGVPDVFSTTATDGLRPAGEKAGEEIIAWAAGLEFRGRKPGSAEK